MTETLTNNQIQRRAAVRRFHAARANGDRRGMVKAWGRIEATLPRDRRSRGDVGRILGSVPR